MTRGVAVNEAYRDLNPPLWVRPAVCHLLETVSKRYLRGLDAVVLTNVGAMNSQRKRGKLWSRKQKLAFSDCRGIYHPRSQSQGAWIEVFVDNVFERAASWVYAIPLLREYYLADTLYHELGHHIHTLAPEFRGREDVAHAWRMRLVREMFSMLHPLMWVGKQVRDSSFSRSQKGPKVGTC